MNETFPHPRHTETPGKTEAQDDTDKLISVYKDWVENIDSLMNPAEGPVGGSEMRSLLKRIQLDTGLEYDPESLPSVELARLKNHMLLEIQSLSSKL